MSHTKQEVRIGDTTHKSKPKTKQFCPTTVDTNIVTYRTILYFTLYVTTSPWGAPWAPQPG